MPYRSGIGAVTPDPFPTRRARERALMPSWHRVQAVVWNSLYGVVRSGAALCGLAATLARQLMNCQSSSDPGPFYDRPHRVAAVGRRLGAYDDVARSNLDC